MSWQNLAVTALLLTSSVLVGAAPYVDALQPWRPEITLWFLMLCPGLAIVRLFHVEQLLVQVSIAVALSMALEALIAEAMVYGGVWSPSIGLAGLVAATVMATLVGLFRDGRRARGGGG